METSIQAPGGLTLRHKRNEGARIRYRDQTLDVIVKDIVNRTGVGREAELDLVLRGPELTVQHDVNVNSPIINIMNIPSLAHTFGLGIYIPFTDAGYSYVKLIYVADRKKVQIFRWGYTYNNNSIGPLTNKPYEPQGPNT